MTSLHMRTMQSDDANYGILGVLSWGSLNNVFGQVIFSFDMRSYAINLWPNIVSNIQDNLVATHFSNAIRHTQ